MEKEETKVTLLDEKNKQKNKFNKKICVNIIVTILIMIILITIYVQLIYPNRCIKNINSNYSNQQYEKVTKYNSKLNTIKEYLKNDKKRYDEIRNKIKISEAMIFFQNKQFDNVLNILKEIEIQDEFIENKINDCKYELGKQYLEEEQYDKSLEILTGVKNKNDLDNLLDKTHYNLSLKYLAEEDYIKSLEELEKIKNKKYDKLDETRKQIHYEYGINNFNLKNYDNAIKQLKIVGNYKDAKKYINNANIEKAEKLIKEDDLKAAKKIYDSLSNKISYNGIKVYERKKQLNNAKDLLKITGKKKATKTYCETRNVWKYDGRWDSWYIDEPSGEYIDTTLELNKNGTFNITGTVYFYAYDDYSTLRDYCKAKFTSRTISIKNIKSIKDIPSKRNIGENTKLLYSNGKFKIEYKVKDDYSINFYNVYSTKVTF